MQITIGSIIRNRAWILPEYLSSLVALDYSFITDRKFLFLENDSTDITLSLLNQFSNNFGERVARVVSESFSGPGHRRGEYNLDDYAHMAIVRNRFIELFLEDPSDYLLSIDTDVIVPPNLFERLLDIAAQPVIVAAAAICNILGRQLDGHMPGNFMVRDKEGSIIHPPSYPLTGVMDVDITGACYLIPREVLEAGVRYGPHPYGEDIPFCIEAKKKGFEIKVLLDSHCEHRMVEV